jgi:hypothetical protein
MKKLCLYWFWIFIIANSCKTRSGEPSPLSPPSTKIFLNSINLSDTNSLSGRIRLHWIGETANGYIKGYEIQSDTANCQTIFNSTNWSFTTRTDSAFLFKINAGAQFDKISFYVRAVDNNNLKDINPPCLQVPVRNSKPIIKLDRPFASLKSVTDTVHSVFTISWFTEDPDGIENLDSVYVKFNQSNWVSFPKSVSQLTFVPIYSSSNDSIFCKILIGNTIREHRVSIGKLALNKFNRVYLKAKDISNTFSVPDSINSFFYKSKTSDILLIDSYKATGERSVLEPILQSIVSQGYDVYDINRNSDIYLPINWNLTFSEYLKLYKKVIWITDANLYGGSLALELGMTAIQNFLNNSGKILVSTTKLPTDINSPIYQYSPFDSISSSVGQARLANGSKIIPTSGLDIAFGTLSGVGLITAATPGYVKPTSKIIYTTQFQAVNGWQGPNIIAAATLGNAGKSNQIYFNTDLHKLNGDTQALKSLIDHIINKEFDY